MKERFDNSILISRITSMCEVRGTSINKMLLESGAGTSTVDNLKKGSAPTVDKLVKIADRLETTTDYLLGRSDIPNMNISVTQTDSIIESSQIGVVNNTPERTAPVKELDEMTTELVRAFKALSFKDKMEIMNAVMKKSQK